MKKSFKPVIYYGELSRALTSYAKAQKQIRLENPIWKFFETWSLHGFKYIGRSKTSILERILWILIVSGSVAFSAYLIRFGIVEPLTANPIWISFKRTDISVDRIPFPAITICNINKVKRHAVENLKSNVLRKNSCPPRRNNSNKHIKDCGLIEKVARISAIALQHVTNVCKRIVSFSRLFHFNEDCGNITYDRDSHGQDRENEGKNYTWTMDRIDAEHKQAIQHVMKAMTNCSEMILKCIWRDKTYPCEGLFSQIPTKFGLCCTFNHIPSFINRGAKNHTHTAAMDRHEMDDDEYKAWSEWSIDDEMITTHGGVGKSRYDVPRHQFEAGMNHGLSVVLNPQLTEYHCKAADSEGFRVRNIHSSFENILCICL